MSEEKILECGVFVPGKCIICRREGWVEINSCLCEKCLNEELKKQSVNIMIVDNEEESRILIAEAMMKYGGSFIKALGKALMCADRENAKKIKEAFSDYWEKYKEMSKHG